MAKVKVDMTGVDPAKSLESDYLQAPPGSYTAKIIGCNPGFSKGDDGKPDKTRPRLEVIFRIVDGNYSQIWAYFTFSDKEFPKKKMDQFLQAVGVLSKNKRRTEFDTEDIVNKTVTIVLKADKDLKGEYRPNVSDVFAYSDDDDLDLSDDELDEEFDEEEELEVEEEETEEESEPYTVTDLKGRSAADLRAILKDEFGVSSKVRDQAKLIELILEAQGEDDDEVIEDDDDEIMEDEEESEFLTEAQLKAASTEELKGYAKDFDIVVKGMTKAKVIAAILEAQGADEEPF